MNISNKFKKGIYFTIDSLIAGGIVLTIILMASSSYIKEQPSTQLNYLSQDLINILATLEVDEIDNAYINNLIDTGTIKNLDNTVLEQIVEFWYNEHLSLARGIVINVTKPWVSNKTGYGLWIENQTIYAREKPISKTLVSSKRIVTLTTGEIADSFRSNIPTLEGSVIVEIRVWD